MLLAFLLQAAAVILIILKPEEHSVKLLCMLAAVPLGSLLVYKFASSVWKVDRAVLVLVLLLTSIGIITLTDICKSEETPLSQAMYAGLGIPAMCVGILLMRSGIAWKRMIPLLMLVCLGALASPWVIGSWQSGARNWIHLGSLSAQPSEFMKPILAIVLAASFSNRPRFLACFPAIGFAAVCCGILLSQRDLGALLLYFLLTVAMYYIATSNGLISLAGLGMGAISAVIAYNELEYVQNRVSIWQNPWSDPLNKGYQLVQSLIAIGSGGLFGMGMGLGMPRKVPLYHSDFIFTSIAEEFGLVFSVCLMAVYVIIIMRGMIIAMNARTSFHSILAFGIVIMLGMQALLIIGGNTKLIPLTGVTLPFVSYGGSSLVSSFFGIGLLLGISSLNAEDELYDFGERTAMEQEMSGY